MILSVTLEIVAGETSIPYISSMCPDIVMGVYSRPLQRGV